MRKHFRQPANLFEWFQLAEFKHKDWVVEQPGDKPVECSPSPVT
jgi:hypothetical protein